MFANAPLDGRPLPEELSEPLEFPRGPLFKAGVRLPCVGFVVRGRVRLLAGLVGYEPVRALDLSAGSTFGLAAVLRDEPTWTTVIVLEACQLQVISAGRMRDLVRANLDVAEWCTWALALEVHRRDATIASFGTNAPDRLQLHFARLLGEGASKLGDGGLKLSVVPTHEELAQAVGVTCRYVSQLLKAAEKAGTISRVSGRYIVPAGSPILGLADGHAASDREERREVDVRTGRQGGTAASAARPERLRSRTATTPSDAVRKFMSGW